MLAEEKGILWYMIGRTEKVLYYIMNDLWSFAEIPRVVQLGIVHIILLPPLLFYFYYLTSQNISAFADDVCALTLEVNV